MIHECTLCKLQWADSVQDLPEHTIAGDIIDTSTVYEHTFCYICLQVDKP